jgi:hypothetical protein
LKILLNERAKVRQSCRIVLSTNFGQNFRMKKLLFLVVILGVAGLITYKLLSKTAPKQTEQKQGPLTISKNSDAFNASFFRLMNDYYDLKDALVEWDTVKANKAAISLQNSADSLDLKELKADSNIVLTAKIFATSLTNDAKGLAGEAEIEQKRRAFNIVTDELYNLVRTVRYDRQIIYHIKCPMAFKDSEEAYWLSNTPKIVNPYLGKKHPVYKDKMTGCGEIVDSLDLSKK